MRPFSKTARVSTGLVLLAALAIGLAAYISRRTSCPPRIRCVEGPFDIWTILWPFGPLLGVVAGFAVAITLLGRRRNGLPRFAPERRALAVATGLAFIWGLVLALSVDLPPMFGWLGFGAAIAAFLLGGAGLRPHGSRPRGVALGIIAYVVAGLVTTVIYNWGFLGDLLEQPTALGLQTIAWPGLWHLVLGGFVG